MIVTVTLNPAVDKVYWVQSLKICDIAQEEFLTRAMRSSTSAGGKGVNISRFLSAFGMDNVAMGFVGGNMGHIVVRYLRQKGVTTNFTWIHGETRVNVTLLEAGREFSPNLIDEPGPEVSALEIDRFLRRYQRMLRQASWVVIGGSVPPGVDPEIYADLTYRAREAGVKVAVTAGGEALHHAVTAGPTIVKPDTREHHLLEGKELMTTEQIIEAGRSVVAAGVEMVIISTHVTGDIAITRDAVWEIQGAVPTTRLRNLVGADDAFLAGILFKTVQGEPIEDVLRFGLAAGLASAESEKKICEDRSVVESEMQDVTLTRI